LNPENPCRKCNTPFLNMTGKWQPASLIDRRGQAQSRRLPIELAAKLLAHVHEMVDWCCWLLGCMGPLLARLRHADRL